MARVLAAPPTNAMARVLAVVEKGSNYATIHLPSPRKYDCLKRNLTIVWEIEDFTLHFTLLPVEEQVCEEPRATASASTAVEVAADSAANSVGVATASASTAVESLAAKPASGFLTLKMEGFLQCTEGNCTTANRVAPRLELGRGSFGTVYQVEEAGVVVKVFEDAAKRSSRAAWVRQELAAATAFPFHENIVRPLDVALDFRNVQIIYPHCGTDLAKFLKHARPEGKKLWQEEEELIMRMVLRAVNHMHEHRLLHTDIKPSNILVEGRGLDCAPEWEKTDGTAWKCHQDLPSRLVQLESFLHVRLADLGSVEPADPRDRMPAERYLHADGIRLSTIWYRAPELALGDGSFSTPIDMWSIGCSFHELLLRKPLFPAKDVDDLVAQCIGMFGLSDASVARLSRLPLFARYEKLPAASAREWMTDLRPLEPTVIAMMQSLLQMEPVGRLSARLAIQGAFFPKNKFELVVKEALCHRGPFSLQQTEVGRALWTWMTAEDYWQTVRPPSVGSSNQRKRKAQCFAESEQAFKREVPGYMSNVPPGCLTCNKTDCRLPFLARRTAAVVRALLARHKQWLKELSVELRAALAIFPEERLMENGRHLLETCLSDTALVYGLEQDMIAQERTDPEHFDGCASLLHAGLTHWGQRVLEYMTADGEWHGLIQKPGSFYIANMCAAWHRVRHRPPPFAEPLFRPDGATPGSPGLHIAVMLRTDVFRADFARRGKAKGRPEDVYDAVNLVVARKLAREPWTMPSLGECMATMMQQ